jgi:hypothetical protein
LYIEPEESAETSVVDFFMLRGTAQFVMTFTPLRAERFQIKGLRFEFFKVAPVAVTFPQPVLYSALEKAALCELCVVSKPDVTYIKLPFRFSLLLKHLRGTLSGPPYAFVQSSPHHESLRLVSPPITGAFNKYPLSPFENEQVLDFEMVPAIEGSLNVHIFIVYSMPSHMSRFVVDGFSVEVKGMKKLHCQSENDRIILSNLDDICSISCPCAEIRTEEHSIVFEDVAKDSQDKKCSLEIEREVLGTIVRDSLTIPRLFVIFGTSEVTVHHFPTVVDFRFDVLCLGQHTGKLVLKQPNSVDWYWVGKTKYVLTGAPL